LRAAADVIGRVGPARLTLAAVASEVGLVPGTLIQRFGSKQGLLVALARHSAEGIDAHHERLRAGHPSPLAALAALVVGAMAPMTTPETFANHLAFLCLDLTDPELRPYALTIHQARSSAINALLTEAIEEGELKAGTDPTALTALVQAILTGTGLNWALDHEGTLPDRLRYALDALLAPHLASDTQPTEQT
jgi:AcrR family transcriptional regulator